MESKVHSSLDYYANTFMKVTVDWLESNTMQLLVGVQSFCPILYFAIQHYGLQNIFISNFTSKFVLEQCLQNKSIEKITINLTK